MGNWTAADIGSQTGRTIVVTGATSGIGLVAARELARAGARVVLAVRDADRGAAAAAAMTGTVEVRRLDLADLASVAAFATAVDHPVDVLVNNAGLMAVPQQRTADGFEMQLGTNFLGHFALTGLLLPRITDRVVTLSSFMHRIGRIDLDDLNWERRRYQRWPAYGQSKLADLMFAYELQRRFVAAGSRLRSMAAHPGYAATNLQSRTESVQDHLMGVFNRIAAQSPDGGAPSHAVRGHRARSRRWHLRGPRRARRDVGPAPPGGLQRGLARPPRGPCALGARRRADRCAPGCRLLLALTRCAVRRGATASTLGPASPSR